MRARPTLILVAMLILGSVSAEAASMRFCWTDAQVAKTTAYAVPVAGTPAPRIKIADDIMAGSTVTAGKRCNVAPFPTTMQRGVDYSVTLTHTNSVGEEGGPSNAVPFLFPPPPAAPTGVTVVPTVP